MRAHQQVEITDGSKEMAGDIAAKGGEHLGVTNAERSAARCDENAAAPMTLHNERRRRLDELASAPCRKGAFQPHPKGGVENVQPFRQNGRSPN